MRFVVRETTGYTINPEAGSGARGGHGATKGKSPTGLSVHDSAYCYRTVAEFWPDSGGYPRLPERRQLAAELAARLEAEHA